MEPWIPLGKVMLILGLGLIRKNTSVELGNCIKDLQSMPCGACDPLLLCLDG